MENIMGPFYEYDTDDYVDPDYLADLRDDFYAMDID
jgi:hypothetical protein